MQMAETVQKGWISHCPGTKGACKTPHFYEWLMWAGAGKSYPYNFSSYWYSMLKSRGRDFVKRSWVYAICFYCWNEDGSFSVVPISVLGTWMQWVSLSYTSGSCERIPERNNNLREARFIWRRQLEGYSLSWKETWGSWSHHRKWELKAQILIHCWKRRVD